MVGVGGSDAMDYHALEGLQCMVERRKGGETGVKAVQMIEGDAVWKAGDEGRWSKELLTAALSRSDTPLGLTVTDGRTQDLVASGELPEAGEESRRVFHRVSRRPEGHHADAQRRDQGFQFRRAVEGQPAILSTQFLLTPEPNVTYSACLMHKVEKMFETGCAPYPVERTLLVSGMLESCLTSKVQDHARLETPHLNVSYKAPKESQFAKT